MSATFFTLEEALTPHPLELEWIRLHNQQQQSTEQQETEQPDVESPLDSPSTQARRRFSLRFSIVKARGENVAEKEEAAEWSSIDEDSDFDAAQETQNDFLTVLEETVLSDLWAQEPTICLASEAALNERRKKFPDTRDAVTWIDSLITGTQNITTKFLDSVESSGQTEIPTFAEASTLAKPTVESLTQSSAALNGATCLQRLLIRDRNREKYRQLHDTSLFKKQHATLYTLDVHQLWELKTQLKHAQVTALAIHPLRINIVAVAYLVHDGQNAAILIWNLHDPEKPEMTISVCVDAEIRSIFFLISQPTKLALGTLTGSLYLTKVTRDGTANPTVSTNVGSAIFSAKAIALNQKPIWLSTLNGELLCFTEELVCVDSFKSKVTRVQTRPDGADLIVRPAITSFDLNTMTNLLLVGTYLGDILLYDTEKDRREYTRFEGHMQAIRALAWHPTNDRRFLSACLDAVLIWSCDHPEHRICTLNFPYIFEHQPTFLHASWLSHVDHCIFLVQNRKVEAWDMSEKSRRCQLQYVSCDSTDSAVAADRSRGMCVLGFRKGKVMIRSLNVQFPNTSSQNG